MNISYCLSSLPVCMLESGEWRVAKFLEDVRRYFYSYTLLFIEDRENEYLKFAIL